MTRTHTHTHTHTGPTQLLAGQTPGLCRCVRYLSDTVQGSHVHPERVCVGVHGASGHQHTAELAGVILPTRSTGHIRTGATHSLLGVHSHHFVRVRICCVSVTARARARVCVCVCRTDQARGCVWSSDDE